MSTYILTAATTFTIATFAIGGVTGFDFSGGSAKDIDVTSLADTAHKFAIGLPERGDFKLDLIWNPDDVGQAELFTLSKSQAPASMVVVAPSGTLKTYTFSIVVKSLTIAGKLDDKWTGSCVMKINGEIAES